MNYQPGSKTNKGYLALPESGSGPGVLVLHAWWGLNDFFVELCDRLAHEGFVALAPDLYAGEIASTIEEAETLQKKISSEAIEQRVVESLDALQQYPAVNGPKIGTIGCSMGAWWAFQLSVQYPETVAATVLFYGVVDGDFSAARSAYQGHFAENDVWDPLEYARQMETAMHAAGRKIDFHIYPGVGHWFLEDNRPDAYDAESALLAWSRTVSFLQSHLS